MTNVYKNDFLKNKLELKNDARTHSPFQICNLHPGALSYGSDGDVWTRPPKWGLSVTD